MPEPRRRRTAHAVEVRRRERLSDSLVRLVVGGPALAGFETPPCTDTYVKVVFVHPDVPRPLPRDEDGRVDLDLVRDELLFVGPGGGYAPEPDAGRHLLAGDLAALPAVAVALEALPADATGHAVLEVHGPEDELSLAAPDGVEVRWVHQGAEPAGVRLVEAVRALPWPDDDVHAFVHGEAGAVKALRRYLRVDRGLGMDRLSISGYWRLGVDDEGWRASKREWNAAIEQEELAEPVATP